MPSRMSARSVANGPMNRFMSLRSESDRPSAITYSPPIGVNDLPCRLAQCATITLLSRSLRFSLRHVKQFSTLVLGLVKGFMRFRGRNRTHRFLHSRDVLHTVYDAYVLFG